MEQGLLAASQLLLQILCNYSCRNSIWAAMVPCIVSSTAPEAC